MESLLTAIRAQIAPLEQRLSVLREMEVLAERLNGEGDAGPNDDGSSGGASRPATGDSPTRARPAPAHRPSAAGGELGARSERVLDALRARGDWMSVSEIAADLGNDTTAESLRSRMQVLVKRGLVEARGSTSKRRYRAVNSPSKPPSTRQPERVRAEVTRTRDEVLAAVEEHGPAAFAALRTATGLGQGQLLGALQELARSARIVQNADGTWQTTASKDAEIAQRNGKRGPGQPVTFNLKPRILAAVVADPGTLSEQRLALALGADREDVALACGELLVNGEVSLRPDGTYTTSLGGPTMSPQPELREEAAA